MKKLLQQTREIQITILLLINMTFIQNMNAQSQKDKEAHKRKWDTPAWTDGIKNPLAENAAWADTGKVLYNKICSVCHGSTGRGDGIAAAGLSIKPANHTSPIVQFQTDGSLFYEISNGHAPMPAYKDILNENQRWALVNYIRVLGKNTKPGSVNKK